MKIAIIGGGPAGLFFAYLIKRADPAHDIVVFERDPEGATYGWGVVFSDVALAFVRDIAPDLYASMTQHQEVFGAMAIEDQQDYLKYLVKAAQNVLIEQGREDSATKVNQLAELVRAKPFWPKRPLRTS